MPKPIPQPRAYLRIVANGPSTAAGIHPWPAQFTTHLKIVKPMKRLKFHRRLGVVLSSALSILATTKLMSGRMWQNARLMIPSELTAICFHQGGNACSTGDVFVKYLLTQR